jgi:hypothetical protein
MTVFEAIQIDKIPKKIAVFWPFSLYRNTMENGLFTLSTFIKRR